MDLQTGGSFHLHSPIRGMNPRWRIGPTCTIRLLSDKVITMRGVDCYKIIVNGNKEFLVAIDSLVQNIDWDTYLDPK